MAYTEFQTQKAKYVLQLGNHEEENKHNIFKGIDALVMETGRIKLDSSSVLRLEKHPQMNMPITYCKENHIPIFMSDTPTTEIGEIRDDVNDMVTVLGVFVLSQIPIHYGFSNKRINKFFGRLYTDFGFILQSSSVGRDALNARKIEEDVSSRVREISGKKFPKIGIVFGACHIGLEYNLKSKRRRDFTIWNWKNLNFGRYAGFDIKRLNKIYEARYNGENWKFKEHNIKLF